MSVFFHPVFINGFQSKALSQGYVMSIGGDVPFAAPMGGILSG
jgi:hypothetical protein